MPTYRKDVKIGTMIPLIKTDDISDGAITKDKLDKDLRDEIEPKKEVVKKRRKQIIIGRSIRPGSVKRSDVENWYAFIERPSVSIVTDVKDIETHLYIRRNYYGEYEEYQEYEKIFNNPYDNHFAYQLIFYPKRYNYAIFKVDNYQRDGNKHYIYLTYKKVHSTLKGQSPTKEWQNGRRVNNKKISLKTIREDLEHWGRYGRPQYGKLEYRRITSRRKSSNYYYRRVKVRKETSWLCGSHKKKTTLYTGLYKVRLANIGYKTNWQTIYVKTRRYDDTTEVKNIIFK